MKKRLLAALLGMTMVAGLLTGCGSNGAKETTKTADGKIQINFWYSGGKTAVIADTNKLFHTYFNKGE